jgi:hypothetical protein
MEKGRRSRKAFSAKANWSKSWESHKPDQKPNYKSQIPNYKQIPNPKLQITNKKKEKKEIGKI